MSLLTSADSAPSAVSACLAAVPGPEIKSPAFPGTEAPIFHSRIVAAAVFYLFFRCRLVFGSRCIVARESTEPIEVFCLRCGLRDGRTCYSKRNQRDEPKCRNAVEQVRVATPFERHPNSIETFDACRLKVTGWTERFSIV